MIRTVTYIKRKSQLKFHSIENLFSTIIDEVSKFHKTELVYTKYAGGSPWIIIKNLMAFKRRRGHISHITGDVHYMALVTSRRAVLTIHDIGSAIRGSLAKRLYIKLFWFWLPALFVKRITVISEFTKKELIKILPFAKQKIIVVSNPVNQDYVEAPYKFNEEFPTILCIGTKSNKNLEHILEAVSTLSCQLHIVGELSERQQRNLEILKIDFKNSFNLSQKGIIQAYVDCDFLCFPSLYEGFGMPIIEAQATGRPVLTSNFGAMVEVAKDSACLVDSFNSNAIRVGIQKIIANASYRNQLIEKGFKNIERFQIDTIAEQYINIYKEMSS